MASSSSATNSRTGADVLQEFVGSVLLLSIATLLGGCFGWRLMCNRMGVLPRSIPASSAFPLFTEAPFLLLQASQCLTSTSCANAAEGHLTELEATAYGRGKLPVVWASPARRESGPCLLRIVAKYGAWCPTVDVCPSGYRRPNVPFLAITGGTQFASAESYRDRAAEGTIERSLMEVLQAIPG
jgi:hypothetical protein